MWRGFSCTRCCRRVRVLGVVLQHPCAVGWVACYDRPSANRRVAEVAMLRVGGSWCGVGLELFRHCAGDASQWYCGDRGVLWPCRLWLAVAMCGCAPAVFDARSDPPWLCGWTVLRPCGVAGVVSDASLQEASPHLAPRGHGGHGCVSPVRRLVGHADEVMRVTPQPNDPGAICEAHVGTGLDGVPVDVIPV